MELSPGFQRNETRNYPTDVSAGMSEQEEELPDIDYYHSVSRLAPASSIQTEYPEKTDADAGSSPSSQSSTRESNQLAEGRPKKRKKLKKIVLLHFEWFKEKQKFGDTRPPPQYRCDRRTAVRQINEGSGNRAMSSRILNPAPQKGISPLRSETKAEKHIRPFGKHTEPTPIYHGKGSTGKKQRMKSPIRSQKTKPTLIQPLNQGVPPHPTFVQDGESETGQGSNGKSVATSRGEPEGRMERDGVTCESLSQSDYQVQTSIPMDLSRIKERRERKENAAAVAMFDFMHKVPKGFTIPKRSNEIPIFQPEDRQKLIHTGFW